MPLAQFKDQFPGVPITQPARSDYDPGLWEKTTQFYEFASGNETIEGIGFEIYLTFARGRLSFLQYFGRPDKGIGGYDAAVRAYGILVEAMINSLGLPERTVEAKTYNAFAAESRPTDGHPDDRYVEAAACTWPAAWIHLSENFPGTLVLELRMGE